MTNERYQELSLNEDLKLTEEEIKEGWLFCCDWDYMLIKKGSPEFQCCPCHNNKEI